MHHLASVRQNFVEYLSDIGGHLLNVYIVKSVLFTLTNTFGFQWFERFLTPNVFCEYTSIENAQGSELEFIKKSGMTHGNEFIVLEKIHGANFSFISDGKEIQYAKRTCPINDRSFFNCGSVVDKYTPCASKAWTMVESQLPENTKLLRLQIYGELFGGYFKGMEPEPNYKLVQSGVYYSNKPEFCCFDIHYTVNVNGRKMERWMNYDKAMEVFQESGFLYLKPLFRGDFDRALMYSNRFKTTIPSMFETDDFKFPHLENNWAEGVVIKPVDPIIISSGKRLILKNKIEIFSERRKPAPLLERADVGKECLWLLSQAEGYVTPQRFDNVYSKHGDIGRNKLLCKFVSDVVEDFSKEPEHFGFKVLIPDEQRFFFVHLKTKCGQILENSRYNKNKKTEFNLL